MLVNKAWPKELKTWTKALLTWCTKLIEYSHPWSNMNIQSESKIIILAFLDTIVISILRYLGLTQRLYQVEISVKPFRTILRKLKRVQCVWSVRLPATLLRGSPYHSRPGLVSRRRGCRLSRHHSCDGRPRKYLRSRKETGLCMYNKDITKIAK